MIEIKEVLTQDDKAKLCDTILHALPDWFGIEEAIMEYIAESQYMPFYAAFDGDGTVGFIAIKVHNAYTSEIYVMGVLQQYHRQGIGKLLVECCERHCAERKAEFLTVKTLDGSAESECYAKTRRFYKGMGFRPLEVFPLLWDEHNPCLFMAKTVKM